MHSTAKERLVGRTKSYIRYYSRAIEEKLGGRPHRIKESLDFIQCLNDCGLQNAGFSGSKYTWCDNKDPSATIWKRLDRLVHNSQWFGVFNATSVTYLSRTCSNYSPLLVKMNFDNTHIIKYFKFLNIWTKHTQFLETVKHSWNKEIKRTCKTLSSWSRQAFGDIYEEPKILEAQMRISKENSVTNNSEENREELSRLRAISLSSSDFKTLFSGRRQGSNGLRKGTRTLLTSTIS
ncbi:hypothetical protein H5410_064602 [Solanum commersonii]|uniref:Uncharacterized protein n=1 Tax=Solanum commersonii TaxID=4109 RepID=A0A9J5VZL2_SOLCO|nr:hypothetical protein H5410_064602 [Solanum commersonii]